MIDYTRRGKPVRIRCYTRTAYYTFQGHETGIVVCEIENGVGRKLVECEWPGIGQSPVFLEEIIFLDEPAP